MAWKIPNPLLQKMLKIAALGLGGSVLGLALIYASYCLRRPARSFQVRSLFSGIDYTRYTRESPRPLVFHVVSVDLTVPGIRFLVTPPGAAPPGKETLADTVPGFLEAHGVQVAINGSFFYPMHVHHPLDYAPHVGEGVNVVGLSISEGNRYSEVEAGWATLCIVSPQEITIEASGECPANTVHGLAGDRMIIKDGQITSATDHHALYPRTVVALDQAKKTLWLVIVDGRQKGYSEGLSLAELAEELIQLGADQALNLDGGGSSTLAVEDNGQARVLNAPIQARVPTNLRPVANHLGIYADQEKAE
ncbi:MAG: phosphodiester glycosidase family protein [Phormidesmis sp. RL_2_1]|nr:phosphodiester glycosidase family protein [Phormidesmis sp. RL_2_1]